MNRGPGNRTGRRESVPGSPPPAHVNQKSTSVHPMIDPGTARTMPTQTVTGVHGSEDNASGLCHTISCSGDDSISSSIPSNQEPQYISEVHRIIEDMMDIDGVDAAHCFEEALIEPPVTADSLAELDLPTIINNPKLRHDINFDRELHFRPNIEGRKGEGKLRSAEIYWKALVAELSVYAVALRAQREEEDHLKYAHWAGIVLKAQRRLPKLFEAVRDILRTLVPEHEQESIDLRFDVDLIMQEVTHGKCDLISLSEWIATVLKAHCAPMRDEVVDQMKARIQHGAWENSHEILADGLRRLIAILEQMKLDVANHQIRYMRPLLIDDTINFQRKYNSHRMRQGKIDAAGARNWLYKEIDFMEAYDPDGEPTHLNALVTLFLRETLLGENDCWPSTFYLDLERLRSVRHELRARVYHEVCWEIFNNLVAEQASQFEHFAFPNPQHVLHSRINAIVGVDASFYDCRQAIAAEMIRLLLMATAHNAPYINHDLAKNVEQRLGQQLQPLGSAGLFRKHASFQYHRFLPKVRASVEEHLRLSIVDLQDALVPAPSSHRSQSRGFGAVLKPVAHPRIFDADMDLVHKLTHVLVLHWHVWGELVYMAMPEDDETTTGYWSTTTAPPRTTPQARAVYAPGHHWLPVGVTVVDELTELPRVDPSWCAPQNDTAEDPSEEQ
nr:protein sok1 [Quercus suber]